MPGTGFIGSCRAENGISIKDRHGAARFGFAADDGLIVIRHRAIAEWAFLITGIISNNHITGRLRDGVDCEDNRVRSRAGIACPIGDFHSNAVLAVAKRRFRREAPVALSIGCRRTHSGFTIIKSDGAAFLSLAADGRFTVIRYAAIGQCASFSTHVIGDQE